MREKEVQVPLIRMKHARACSLGRAVRGGVRQRRQVAKPPEPKYDLKVAPPRNRVWIVSAGAAVIAVSLFVVGLYLWRMMVPTPCGPSELCLGHLPPHHLHRIRAEAVWLVTAVFAFIAVASVLSPDSFRHFIRQGSIEDSYRQTGEIPGHTATGGRPVGL